MSARPGRIKETIGIDLDRGDAGETDIRASRRFGEYRHHIWSLLRQQHLDAVPEEKELAHA
jgi:NitT/TauT family transport system ATP-binding protein